MNCVQVHVCVVVLCMCSLSHIRYTCMCNYTRCAVNRLSDCSMCRVANRSTVRAGPRLGPGRAGPALSPSLSGFTHVRHCLLVLMLLLRPLVFSCQVECQPPVPWAKVDLIYTLSLATCPSLISFFFLTWHFIHLIN